MPAVDSRAPAAGGAGAAAFPYGLASGDVDARSVTIWTRPADALARRPIEWFVAPVVGRRDAPVRSGRVTSTPERDLTVHVTVSGLEPGTAYRFGFAVGDQSIEGLTRTLPERADQLRFVVACCSRWGWPGFERYAAIIDEDPAFVLHLGDYIYESGAPGRHGTPDPPHECVTLTDYRRRYRQHRQNTDLQHLHARVPFLATWDDHEVVNNAPGLESPDRRRDGQRAWREWLPMRWPEPGGASADLLDIPNDRQLSVAGLLDLAMIDTRFGGRHSTDTDGPEIEPDHGPILAESQWQALTDLTDRATAPWLAIASQVQVGPMTLGWIPVPWHWPPWRRIVNPDQWDGHPTERQRLHQLLAGATGRPVILSGDLHSAWSRALDHNGRIGHEFTAPSIAGNSYGASFRAGTKLPSGLLRAALRLFNRGIDLLDLDRHGYLVCDVTPDAFTATFVLAGDSEIERIPQILR